MNNKFNLSEIYNDFFADTTFKQESVPKETLEHDIYQEIDNLLLSDEAKILLKKIEQYMKKYQEGIEKNYIPFLINIITDNKKLEQEVIVVLTSLITKYNYTSKREIEYLSFYKCDKVDKIDSYLKNKGIVVIEDINIFDTYDNDFKTKFGYYLKEYLKNNTILVVVGKNADLGKFYQSVMLDNDALIIDLHDIKPNAQDIYDEVKKGLSDEVLSDEISIGLLDYITKDYIKSEDDAATYIDTLVKYISFHKTVPTIKEDKTVTEIFKDLNELVGLDKVKKALYELVDLITLKNKTSDDLKINNINLHMVFLGNPGTGKTTVARMIANILYNLGYIKQNKLIEVDAKGLIGEYVGQTSPKTMGVINQAMGGVLFIDEAYILADKNGNNYNGEAIATLIKAMEDYRDSLVIIFAGYTKEMQSFLNSNSGIVSRIGYTLEFDDYTLLELREIFKQMVEKAGFLVMDEALEEFDNLARKYMETKNFGNARFARNVFEKTVLRHATNTKNVKNKRKLKTITKEDITY